MLLTAGYNGRNWKTLNAKILGRAVACLSVAGQKKLSSNNLTVRSECLLFAGVLILLAGGCLVIRAGSLLG
jgi:hypothetical protein